MKAVAEAIGVARSNLVERLQERPKKRIGRPPLPDDRLVAEIKAVIAELPTSGYRGVHAILKRQALAADLKPPNQKRVYRVMKVHGLLLDRHAGGVERRHDGRIAVDERNRRWCSDGFLKALVKAVPQRHSIHHLPKNRVGPSARWRAHMFDMLCDANGIEHRLTKPNHPWTNGQVGRMNRTLKDATVNRYHYETYNQLKGHLHTFLMAYNFTKRLKTLRGLTPYEHICKVWTTQPN